MDWLVHLRIAGSLLILLALCHAWFPRWLEWDRELSALSLLNRQIFKVHSFFIAMVVALNGILYAGFGELLLAASPLRAVVLVGIGAFWGARLIVQLLVYDRALWRGHPARTGAHVFLVAFWFYQTMLPLAIVCAH